MFALIDGNNFFVSCERVFRPDLWHKPVIVLSNNDGCVISRSSESKALGIAMGVPFYQITSLIKRHQIHVFSANFELYSDLSRRMMTLIASLVPHIEVYSIDEAFVDLTGITNPDHYAHLIRDQLNRYLGLPACIGIAPTKTLAKLCNYFAKKNPVYGGIFDWSLLNIEQRQHYLAATFVGEIWGIGRKLVLRLTHQGIKTALDLQRTDPALLRKRYGVTVEQTQRELNGLSCLSLDMITESQQQIMRSRSFGRPVYQLDELRAAISHHSHTAATALRRIHCEAALVGISIRTSYKNESGRSYHGWDSRPLPVASADSLTITRAALDLLARIFKPGFAYHKASVLLSGLSRYRQGDLWHPGDSQEKKALMQALDAINQRYGPQTIHSTAELIGQHNWHSRQQYRSPRYTTQWNELPSIGA